MHDGIGGHMVHHPWAAPPLPPPPGYGQWVGGTHPTGMHSCFCFISVNTYAVFFPLQHYCLSQHKTSIRFTDSHSGEIWTFWQTPNRRHCLVNSGIIKKANWKNNLTTSSLNWACIDVLFISHATFFHNQVTFACVVLRDCLDGPRVFLWTRACVSSYYVSVACSLMFQMSEIYLKYT